MWYRVRVLRLPFFWNASLTVRNKAIIGHDSKHTGFCRWVRRFLGESAVDADGLIGWIGKYEIFLETRAALECGRIIGAVTE